jgi:hypothetical protein
VRRKDNGRMDEICTIHLVIGRRKDNEEIFKEIPVRNIPPICSELAKNNNLAQHPMRCTVSLDNCLFSKLTPSKFKGLEFLNCRISTTEPLQGIPKSLASPVIFTSTIPCIAESVQELN